MCWGVAPPLDDTTSLWSSPTAVPRTSGAIDVVAGLRHGCSLHADGSVRCWGENTYGEVGDGTTTPRDVATPVLGLTDAVAVAAGNRASCALRAGGRVTCWGPPFAVEVTDPVTGETSIDRNPREIPGLGGVVDVAPQWRLGPAAGTTASPAEGAQLSTAARSDGSAVRFRREGVAEEPVGEGVVDVAQGGDHGCALDDRSRVYCVGDSGRGQLGDGTFADSSPFVRVRF